MSLFKKKQKQKQPPQITDSRVKIQTVSILEKDVMSGNRLMAERFARTE